MSMATGTVTRLPNTASRSLVVGPATMTWAGAGRSAPATTIAVIASSVG